MDFASLAFRMRGGLESVRACLILSRDGLTLGAYPQGQEDRAREAWERLQAMGDLERGFVEVGREVWVVSRRGPYAAIMVADMDIRPGMLLDRMDAHLRAAEEARTDEVKKPPKSSPARVEATRRPRMSLHREPRSERRVALSSFSSSKTHEEASTVSEQPMIARVVEVPPVEADVRAEAASAVTDAPPEPVTDVPEPPLPEPPPPPAARVVEAPPQHVEVVEPSLPPLEVVEPPSEAVSEVVEAPPEPVAEVVEAPPEPVAEVVEAPPEPVVEVVEAPPEPVAEVVEAPPEPVVEVVEAPPEPVAEVVEAPPEPVAEPEPDAIAEIMESSPQPAASVTEAPVVDVPTPEAPEVSPPDSGAGEREAEPVAQTSNGKVPSKKPNTGKEEVDRVALVREFARLFADEDPEKG